MNNLLTKQKQLQQQARQVINQLRLKQILNKHGEYKLVGSCEYGLMTWRDIDIDVVFEHEPTDQEFWRICKEIFSTPQVALLTLVDNRQHTEANRPKSMYIGVKYQDQSNHIWKIDIRLLAQNQIVTDDIAKLIFENVNKKTKQIILKIKSQVHHHPKYHKEFQSTDIYKAVLQANVTTLEEFQDYLHKQGNMINFHE